MLIRGVPWQWALARSFIASIAYLILLVGAIVLGSLGWVPLVGAALPIVAFTIILGLIPLFMNLSRSYFTFLLGFFACHIVATLLAYSLYYWNAGLLHSSGVVYSFSDSLYFSITTWTTLGYGDFSPVPQMRLMTSLEALTGVVSMAIGISLLWLWCTENLIPKEMALFDGNRRHRKDISIYRMRIRTLTGKERYLGPDWLKPPKPGSVFRWNPKGEEWEVIEDPSGLQEGDTIIHGPEDDQPQQTAAQGFGPKDGPHL